MWIAATCKSSISSPPNRIFGKRLRFKASAGESGAQFCNTCCACLAALPPICSVVSCPNKVQAQFRQMRGPRGFANTGCKWLPSACNTLAGDFSSEPLFFSHARAVFCSAPV